MLIKKNKFIEIHTENTFIKKNRFAENIIHIENTLIKKYRFVENMMDIDNTLINKHSFVRIHIETTHIEKY